MTIKSILFHNFDCSSPQAISVMDMKARDRVMLLVPLPDKSGDMLAIKTERQLLKRFPEESPLEVIGEAGGKYVELTGWPDPDPDVLKHILELMEGRGALSLSLPFERLRSAYDYFNVPMRMLPIGMNLRFQLHDIKERQTEAMHLLLRHLLDSWICTHFDLKNNCHPSNMRGVVVTSVKRLDGGFLPYLWEPQSYRRKLPIRTQLTAWDADLKETFTKIAVAHSINVVRFERGERLHFLTIIVSVPDLCAIQPGCTPLGSLSTSSSEEKSWQSFLDQCFLPDSEPEGPYLT